MTFADLVRGVSLFVDANTFVFHFQPHVASHDADFDRVPTDPLCTCLSPSLPSPRGTPARPSFKVLDRSMLRSGPATPRHY